MAGLLPGQRVLSRTSKARSYSKYQQNQEYMDFMREQAARQEQLQREQMAQEAANERFRAEAVIRGQIAGNPNVRGNPLELLPPEQSTVQGVPARTRSSRIKAGTYRTPEQEANFRRSLDVTRAQKESQAALTEERKQFLVPQVQARRQVRLTDKITERRAILKAAGIPEDQIDERGIPLTDPARRALSDAGIGRIGLQGADGQTEWVAGWRSVRTPVENEARAQAAEQRYGQMSRETMRTGRVGTRTVDTLTGRVLTPEQQASMGRMVASDQSTMGGGSRKFHLENIGFADEDVYRRGTAETSLEQRRTGERIASRYRGRTGYVRKGQETDIDEKKLMATSRRELPSVAETGRLSRAGRSTGQSPMEPIQEPSVQERAAMAARVAARTPRPTPGTTPQSGGLSFEPKGSNDVKQVAAAALVQEISSMREELKTATGARRTELQDRLDAAGQQLSDMSGVSMPTSRRMPGDVATGIQEGFAADFSNSPKNRAALKALARRTAANIRQSGIDPQLVYDSILTKTQTGWTDTYLLKEVMADVAKELGLKADKVPSLLHSVPGRPG